MYVGGWRKLELSWLSAGKGLPRNMVLLKGAPLLLDSSIKEIEMKELKMHKMNITIFHKADMKSRKWAKEQFDKVCSLIPFDNIEEKQVRLDGCYCKLADGTHVKTVICTPCNVAGRRCEIAIVQEELCDEDVKTMVMPCLWSSNIYGYLMLRGGI